MEENKQEEILKVILDRMNQEDVWFTSKEDDVYGSAKNLFKLDEYGDLNDKSKERLLKEVEDLLGDGATYLIEAVDQWIQDNLIQGTISYKDNLHMNYTPKEISEEVTAYQEKGVEDLELGTLDDKGKEKKLEEGYKITSYYDNKYKGVEDSTETDDVSSAEEFVWDKVQKGNYVELVDIKTGDIKRYTPDNIETAEGVEDLLECKKVTEGIDKQKYIDEFREYAQPIVDSFGGDITLGVQAGERLGCWVAVGGNSAKEANDLRDRVIMEIVNNADESKFEYYCLTDKINFRKGSNKAYIEAVFNMIDNVTESKKITESKAKLYQLEANDANHGKLFARFNEVGSVNLSDYKEVADIDIEDNMPDDDALEYIFTLGNTNQDLRDANPEMRSISVSDVVELNGKYYYCDAFGWKDISGKLTESKKVEESDNEDTLEIRTNFRIQIVGQNSLGDSYVDDDNSVELLDRYPEIEPDELFDKANKMLKGEDLAEYVPEKLKGIVHSIKLHFEPYELVAVIKADKSLYESDELKEELANYIEGQYSDGWGEGFEQRPIMEVSGFEDDQYEQVTADVYIQPMVRYEEPKVYLAEKKTLKNSKEVGRKKVVEVITNLELGKDGLPRLPDPYEMQYRFQDDLYQIINKGPEGVEGYCYAISDDDSYTGTWSIYGKSDEGIIDYEDNVEDYNECVKLLAKFDDVALQESRKLKSTLTESSDTSKRKRLNEENQKSADLISNALSSKDFDIDTPAGQIIKRTSELFNALSDKQYDVQVTFDNGESQSAILLGNQGGKVIITITNGNEPLKAFANGNFELTEENFEILNDIKEQISVL